MKRLFVVIGTLMTGGCATPWSGPVADTTGRTKPAPVESVPLRDAEPEPVTAMAAVEAFLDRTRDYQLDHRAEPPAWSAAPTIEATHLRAMPGPADSQPVNNPQTVEAKTTLPEMRSVANAQVSLDSTPPRPRQAVPVLQQLRVREAPAPLKESPEPTTPSARTTNQPLDAVEGDVVDDADRFLEALSRRAKGSGRFADALRLRVLRDLLDRPNSVADDDAASTLPMEARRLASQWVDVYRALSEVAESPLQPCDEAIERIERTRELLVERADPTVSAIALCRKVVTFGVYEPMPLDELAAGRAIQTIVYCELKNLRSELTPEGQNRTLLSSRLELFGADGRSVWSQEEPNIEDLCRRKRSDFFIAQRIMLPANLPAGEYVLKVTITDELSNRMNEGSLPFTLRAQGTVAKNP